MLRGYECDAGIDQRLLRVQDVEDGALADGRLLACAKQGDLRRLDLGLRGGDLRLAGEQLAPSRNQVGARLIADLLEIETLLVCRLLRLPDQRIFGAALIDRYAHLRYRRGAEFPYLRDRLLRGFLNAGLQRDGRKQRPFADFHVEKTDVDAVHGGSHARIFRERDIGGIAQGFRQITVHWRSWRELSGFVADDAAKVRARRRQGGFGGEFLGAACCELGLRLGDVGGGDKPRTVPLTGLPQGFLKNPCITALHLQNRGVAQVVHIDRGSR